MCKIKKDCFSKVHTFLLLFNFTTTKEYEVKYLASKYAKDDTVGPQQKEKQTNNAKARSTILSAQIVQKRPI